MDWFMRKELQLWLPKKQPGQGQPDLSVVKFIYITSSAFLLNERILAWDKGSKTNRTINSKKHKVGSWKRLQNTAETTLEILERLAFMKQEQNAIRKEYSKNKNTCNSKIAKIKNYVVGLEDKVIEIIWKEEQKDWKK